MQELKEQPVEEEAAGRELPKAEEEVELTEVLEKMKTLFQEHDARMQDLEKQTTNLEDDNKALAEAQTKLEEKQAELEKENSRLAGKVGRLEQQLLFVLEELRLGHPITGQTIDHVAYQTTHYKD